jgi:hypothetical protein
MEYDYFNRMTTLITTQFHFKISFLAKKFRIYSLYDFKKCHFAVWSDVWCSLYLTNFTSLSYLIAQIVKLTTHILLQKYGKCSIDELIGHYLDTVPAPTKYQAPHDSVINSVASDLGWAAFSNK